MINIILKKIESEDVAKKLQLRDIELVHLHGDMHQQERNSRITSFRTTMPVMVATDVAGKNNLFIRKSNFNF